MEAGPAYNEGSNRYRSVRTIASGGMGRVDLAIREEGAFRRVYAIKRLRDEYREDHRARQMFLDEARVAGLLRHPNVVSVLDVGEDAAGPYLVMDFIEGLSAPKLLHQLSERGVLMPVQIAARIMREVAAGLHAAHELVGTDGRPLNLVHRDVSPQNILLGFDGIARLTDFGIAKVLGRVTETTTGLLKGKVGYMAPEQLRFEDPDRRSDLFSFGVVLFELLSGRRLYHASSVAESARSILNEPPPDIHDTRDDVPPQLVELLFELLAKDPSDRPDTAREVGDRLEHVIAELSVEEPPLSLADYLDEHFPGERDRLRSQLVALWRGEGEQLDRGAPPTASLVTEAPTIAMRPPRARRSRLRALAWGALAVGLVVITGGTWAAVQSDPAARSQAQGRSPDPVVPASARPAGAAAPDASARHQDAAIPSAAAAAVRDGPEEVRDASRPETATVATDATVATGAADAAAGRPETTRTDRPAQAARDPDPKEGQIERRHRRKGRARLRRQRRRSNEDDVLWEWQ